MFTCDLDAQGFATLTFDMPGRSQNVFNGESLQALSDALEGAFADPAVRGIVLTSGKQTFVAGADLASLRTMAFGGLSAEALDASVGALGTILRRMETAGKPVVAAINGTALGGGLELALACHRRIVADAPGVKLGLPEATLGLLPGAGGTQRLPRLIGIPPSMPLLIEGKQLAPAAAKAAGFVDEVVAPADLIGAAKAWLATNPAPTQPWDRKGYQVPGGGPEEPALRGIFMVGNATVAARTQGNYPAARAILSCLFEGLRMPIDQGLVVERRYFVSLLLDPVAGALVRTMFFSLQDANKLTRRPAGVPRLNLTRLGVLGAGLMGSGIAFVAAQAGIQVVVIDVDQAAADKCLAYAAERLDKEVARKKLTEEKKQAILARLHPTTDYTALTGCECVIEAVFEDRKVKAAVTRQAEAVLGPDAIFGSNTSTLPITGLAEASSRPDRFVGLHFFSPVEKMQLVEVIVGEQTSEATLAHALDVVSALRKTPIVVNDSRGFYTSRVFGTYLTEGVVMLQEGIAPALIENAGRMSGMPMPPLGLADEVGLGLMYQVGLQTARDLGDLAPPNPSRPVLELLVRTLDRQGKRNRAGFYDYTAEGKRLWRGLSEHFPPAAEQPEVGALIERFQYVQAIETARCLDEGVVRAIEDADVGAILGWGFSPHTGGPVSLIDGIGLAAFVARADTLADLHGERFRPPGLLRRMAAEGRRFYPTEEAAAAGA
jgi:3-hydroxyacyl-CoA dehydrogenase/enoyl-CoA hydratase/3-hydroxybutyryl-CoA epimerase